MDERVEQSATPAETETGGARASGEAGQTGSRGTASSTTIVELLQAAPEVGSLDLAIAAWLHAKEQKSHSGNTRSAYATILQDFRLFLREQGLDLDAADPRRVRALLAASRSTSQEQEERVDYVQVERAAAEGAAAIALAAQAFASRLVHRSRTTRPVAPATTNLRLAAISSFYIYALRHELLHGINPIDRVARSPVRGYRGAIPLAYEDLRERLSTIDVNTAAGLRDYALLVLALYTGRRLSELAGLRREHVVIRPDRVEITWVRCKGGRVMRDELPRKGPQGAAAEALVAWVMRLYGEDGRPDPLLPTPSPALVPLRNRATLANTPQVSSDTANAYGMTVDRPVWISLANAYFGWPLSTKGMVLICEQRLGTGKFQTLRHTFARSLEDAGAKVSEIQERLGHENLATTGRYLVQLRQGENRHLSRLSALYGLEPRFSDDHDSADTSATPPPNAPKQRSDS